MSTVYIASEDCDPWCHLCGEVVSATVKVVEKVYACASCLRDLSNTLHRAVNTPIADLTIRVTYYRPLTYTDGRSQVTSKVNVSIESDLPAPPDANMSNTWTAWGDNELQVPGTLLASGVLEEIVNGLAWWAAAAERMQFEHVAKANGTPVPHQCAGTDPVKVVPMLLGAIGSIHAEVEQRLRCTEQSETSP